MGRRERGRWSMVDGTDLVSIQYRTQRRLHATTRPIFFREPAFDSSSVCVRSRTTTSCAIAQSSTMIDGSRYRAQDALATVPHAIPGHDDADDGVFCSVFLWFSSHRSIFQSPRWGTGQAERHDTPLCAQSITSLQERNCGPRCWRTGRRTRDQEDNADHLLSPFIDVHPRSSV